jgi:GT2 family glycosyltransferase
MTGERRNFTDSEKTAILREHLIDQVPILQVCEKHGLQPTVIYEWQKSLFEKGAAEIDNARNGGGGLQQAAEAHDFQQRLERDTEKARHYQQILEGHVADLEATARAGVMPRVDIMVVAYNASRWLEGFVESLRKLDYAATALRLIFVDNGSRDDTVVKMEQLAPDLRFSMELIRAGRNLGFTGGYGRAMRYGDADFYFVVNLDTVIAPDAIRLLVQRMTEDPAVGIAEARQAPREHPKYYDPITGETSWCSGACMMVRARAMRQVGGGFLKSFFMYLEDIDLSWRMWIGGWKCVYVRAAVVQHFTEDLDPNKTPKLQHYYTMRNGALMQAMYRTPGEVLLHYLAMLRVATHSRNPLWHKWGTLQAIFASLPRLPRAILERRYRGRRGKHRWVFFNGWTYGRHARDLALIEHGDERVENDLLAEFPNAEARLKRDVPLKGHVSVHPGANVAGQTHAAFLVYDTAEVTFKLAVAAGQELRGAVAVPMECWSSRGTARFSICVNGHEIWNTSVTPEELAHRQWVAFNVPMEASEADRPSRVSLRFDGDGRLAWGLWGTPRVVRPAPEVTDDSWRDRLESPAVSIVMPTHNRADQLPRVVARLMAQDVPPEHFEVIIVDSNSSDATPRVLDSLKARYQNLRSLRCDRSRVAATRNMGLDVARAPLVLLLDDDILVGRDLLTRVLRTSRKHADKVLLARIVAPWQDSCDPFERFLWQSQDVNLYNFDDPDHVPPNHFYTACVVIPRSVLGNTRFDENFIASGVEDIEFGFRLLSEDARMVFMPDVEVQHEYYPTYLSYRRKKLRHGYLLGYFFAQHPEHAHRFVFEREVVRYHRLLRLASILSAPGAALLYVLERIRYAPRSLLRPLYLWTYMDLRLCMYRGLRLFRQGRPLQ